jgi:signal transduction histidine kinase
MHQGTIKAESKFGEWTKMTIQLPIEQLLADSGTKSR